MRRQELAEKSLHDQTNLLPKAQLLIVFGALVVTLLITFIDQNGISVALPTIAESLGAQDTISWAGTSSLIANTVFSMLYGRLSDLFGRKAVYLWAIGLLAVADLLCGLSRNPAMLYVFRAFAGVGGGGITNLTMIIVSDIVTLEQRGKYQGIIGAFVGLGNVAGPFVAAAFIEKSTWRGYFYLLAPLAALCGVIAFFLLPSNSPKTDFKDNAKKIDYTGILASSVAVIFLLIPISGGGAYFPWKSAMVITMLVIGACSLVVFVLLEWRVAKLPMMPVQMFKNPVITVLLVQNFLFGAVYQSYLYYLPLYYQNVRGYSAIVSACLTMPVVVTQSIGSILSGQYISRKHRYGEVLWVGFGLWTLGSGLTCIFDRNTHPAIIVVILCFVGFGVGNIFQPTLVALQAQSSKARRAVVISNRNFFRCSGGACGLAISAAALQATLRSKLPEQFKYLAESTYSVPKLGPEAMDRVLDAYMSASRSVFILQAPLIGLCLVGCFWIKDRGLEFQEEQVEKSDDPVVLVDEEKHDGSSEAGSPNAESGRKEPLSRARMDEDASEPSRNS